MLLLHHGRGSGSRGRCPKQSANVKNWESTTRVRSGADDDDDKRRNSAAKIILACFKLEH